MSDSLIAENRLALEPLIRAKLTAALATVPVGGLIEYLELLSGKTPALPAIYVYHDGDNPSNGTGSPHQIRLTQTWVVVTVTPLERDVNGHADMAPTGQLIAATLNALSGQRMAATLKPLAWVGNELQDRAGLLFCYDIYSQPIEMR
jgi:hypothetical protein